MALVYVGKQGDFADRGRKVDDRVDSVEGAGDRGMVAHVAHLQLDLGAQVTGSLTARVHLGIEVVQRANAVTGTQQRVAEV